MFDVKQICAIAHIINLTFPFPVIVIAGFAVVPDALAQIGAAVFLTVSALNECPTAGLAEGKAVFNLREAATYLGISVPTLAALLRNGEIPCRRAGQRWLISKTALDTWLNANTDN